MTASQQRRIKQLEKAALSALHKIRNKTTAINSAGRILGDERLQSIARELDTVADSLREAVNNHPKGD